ncbi:glycosyltransferase [Eubacterium coprostanoligenes]|uniref:Glycosyltransferase involved in cell wall bisynthesis n=1 Tax=Eubacterium coprostanoligenes TaxID=290054 RepID=A0A1T4KD84_9FIRM|nr:glycosyltransferase [Eubacterium coprostanoligenes]SJZ40346.1 Glycosyltransferase involved in cell wall bisynthesis [Eubacterium coprostanoligenes]
MKKKIFIFSHAMEIGGAERALLGLLNSIDYSKYEVDLFLLKHSGELMPLIPKQVNLLPEISQYSAIMKPMVLALKEGQIKVVLGRLCGKLKAKLYDIKHTLNRSAVAIEYSHKHTVKYLPKVNNEHYDIAISFLTPHYIVSEKVNADKKIAWIHTDYSTIELDVKSELAMWSKFDNIVSISDDVTRAFLSTFPSLENKIVKIENILSKDFIEEQADLFNVKNEMTGDSIKLLSIGRFCEAKNFDDVPEIASIIKSKGVDFKWYIIGYGADENLIKSKIAQYNMEDTVIILGKKENPYPYIKACDIYVQPSRYEGKCVAVREAQILNKPVIITNYASSKSQLQDGFDGVIVPMDNQGCADGIVKVIDDKDLQNQLIENTKKTDYTNSKEIEKLYKLIGD